MSRAAPKPAEAGHNSDPAASQLRAYFDRWLALEARKAEVAEDAKEMFAEMKGQGFDTKAARAVFRDMTRDAADREEEAAVYDLYWSALQRAMEPRAHPAHSARENIEKFPLKVVAADLPPHDPETGELADLDVTAMFTESSEPTSSPAETMEPEPTSSPAEAAQPEAGPPPPASGEIPETPPAGQSVPADTFTEKDVPAFLKAPKRGADVHRIRPFCQHPDDSIKCGGYGSVHCPRCEKLAQEARK